uniref:(northern house mosquito) hypothetical protein n=1 Tax=Culex pipiens TaxID=7175 RepID=A0A8D8FDU8_CULPI
MAKDRSGCWGRLAAHRRSNPPSRVATSGRCLRVKSPMHRYRGPATVGWGPRRISFSRPATRNSRNLAKREPPRRPAKATPDRRPGRNRSTHCGEPIDLPGGSGGSSAAAANSKTGATG